MSFDERWLFLRGDPAGAEKAAFDDRDWRSLDVPHDWRIEDLPHAPRDADGGATADPSGMAFATSPSPEGTPPPVIGPFDVNANRGSLIGNVHAQGSTVSAIGWYRKHFTIAAAAHRPPAAAPPHESRVELRFDGVYGHADFYLNGHHLGFHPNGYTSFAFDLTPHLSRGGPNVLAVRVDCGGVTSRWYSGSGIYRHTWLTTTGSVWIPLWGVHVMTPDVTEARSVVRAEVEVASLAIRRPAGVRVTILDENGATVGSHTIPARTLTPGKPTPFVAIIPVPSAELWSPDSPVLYTARSEVLVEGQVVDTVDTSFGIRRLTWDGVVGFELNGARVKINGAGIHHDHGPLGAAALGRAEERKIELLKAAGFNAIRTAHNPPSPYLLDVCDQLGMLVWDEFSDVWDQPKTPNDYSQYFPAHWHVDLTSMIRRDRNHASVIIWSLGNEIGTDPHGYGPQLYELVKSLDSTRPVTIGGVSAPYLDVSDLHYGNLSSELSGEPARNAAYALHESFGTHAITQSESFPATIYDDWKLAQDHPWFAGSWVWAGWDYLGEAGCGATPVGATYVQAAGYAMTATQGGVGYPWFQDFQGDLDLIGQRKPQNFWRAVVCGRSPLEILVVRPTAPDVEQYAALWGYYDELESWTWNVAVGQPLTVHAYTFGDRVRLILNGREIAAARVVDADQRVASFSVPYAPGRLTAVATLRGTELARKTLTTTGPPAAIRLSSDVTTLTTSRDDLAHVLAEVVDAQQRCVPDAVLKLQFAVEGPGELVGVANEPTQRRQLQTAAALHVARPSTRRPPASHEPWHDCTVSSGTWPVAGEPHSASGTSAES